jgi:nucleoid-associated protein YgaU
MCERSSQLDSGVTNSEAGSQADGDAPSAGQSAAAAAGGGQAGQSWWTGHRALWLWGGLAVVSAAVIGASIGRSLATRQGGLLSTQGGGARPTIVVGTVAAAPSAAISPTASAVVPTASVATEGTPARVTEYVVKPGDTLRSIAQEQYGDAGQWPKIYQANRDVIGPNPDALVAGTTLQLPP